MYEELTKFIPLLQTDNFGEWVANKNDDISERPIHFLVVHYSDIVIQFTDAVYQFIDEHPEFGLGRYRDILISSGIEWELEAMQHADVEKLDGITLMALLVGAVRAERFSEGALLAFYKNGSITKWIYRLKEIDQER
ncbi:TPA: hypothetical protein U0398_001606 [Streptococcus suis]|nr:hypothetical protein [Streptococcus suis]